MVVRVRTIQEGIATAAAAKALASALETAVAAKRARARAAAHPLANATGPLAPDDLMTSVGVATALRETALTAERRAGLAAQVLEEAQQQASSATAHRKTAERLVERRQAAVRYEQQRRSQRTQDEYAAARSVR